MSPAPALLAAAAGVALGHAVLPDHWVPLAVVARTRRYPLARVARLSVSAGAAHVLVSIVLGGVIIIAGLPLGNVVRQAQDAVVGGLLVATGVAFAVLAVRSRHSGAAGRHHHDHGAGSWAAVAVPFGAAASPDLTILPVFLAATAVGTATALATVAVFGAVTIGTIAGLTLVAATGGYQVRGAWLERWGNAITALVLVVIGGLVLAGVI